MANEFKIKKGLIVTGADGGTVVDIQGSQGQLFSVTDDLSGSIFAVSDISGVPILDVNSNGTIQFSDLGAGTLVTDANGNISVSSGGGAGGPYLPLSAGASYPVTGAAYFTAQGGAAYGTINLESDDPFIRLYDNGTGSTTDKKKWDIRAIGAAGFETFDIRTVNDANTVFSTKLSIAHNGNATFAGNVLAEGSLITRSVNANVTISGDTSGNIYYNNASGEHRWKANGSSVNSMNLSSSLLTVNENATFTGNVGIGTTTPGAKLEVEGDATGDDTPQLIVASGGADNNAIIHFTDDAGSQVNAIGALEGNTLTLASQNELVFKTNTSSILGTTDTRMIIDTNGNVGIGTTSPVNGKLVIDSTANQIAIETGTAGDGRLNIGHFSNGTFIGTYGDDGGVADLIRFGTHSGDERMRITSSGNVGIGITNPTAKLHVANEGEGEFAGANSSAAGDSHLMLKDEGGTSRTLMSGPSIVFQTPANTDGTNVWATSRLLGSPAAAGSARGTFSIQVRDQYDPLSDGTSWNWRTALTAINTGNVGIGTTSPERKLHVFAGESNGATSNTQSTLVLENSTNAYLQFLTPGYSESGILFGDTDNDRGALVYSHSADAMNFRVAAETKMYINSSGNVGIGTTSPAVRLDFGSATGKAFHLYTSGTDYYGFNMLQYDSGPFSTNIFAGNGGDIKLRTASGTSTQSTRLTVKAGGNVGIGTNNPTTHLEVVASQSNSSIRAGGLEMQSYAVNNSWYAENLYYGSGGWKLRSNGYATQMYMQDGKITFNRFVSGNAGDTVTPYSTMILASNGNVGIGTTSPVSKLHVDGNTQLGRNGNNYPGDPQKTIISGQGIEDAGDGNFYGSYGFLELAANSNYTGSARRYAITNGLDANKFAIIRSDSNIGTMQLGVAGAIPTGAVADFVINNTGNVGIGTSTPNAKLDVQGTQGQLFSVTDDLSGDIFSVADISGVPILNVNSSGVSYFDGSLGIGTSSIGTNDKLLIKTSVDNSVAQGLVIQRSANEDEGYINYNGGGFQFRSTDGDPIVFGQVSNERMRINSDGTVGIGPGALDTAGGDMLHVDGTLRVGPYFSTSDRDFIKLIPHGTDTKIYSPNERFHIENPDGNIIITPSSTGGVGIGTTSPSAPLDVSGVRAGRDFSIAGRGTVRIDANGLNKPSDVLFGHTPAANEGGWNGVYWSLSSRGTSDNGKFQLWRGSGHASPYNSELRVLTVLPNGNVGIGATSPGAKLDVDGDIIISDSGDRVFATDSLNGAFELGDIDALSDEAVVQGDGAFIFLKNAGNTTLTTTVDNRVGIGTSSPGSKLDIVGATNESNSSLLRVRTTDNPNAPEKVVGFYVNTNTERGFISVNQYSTAYSTSSDYRLKENIVPISNSIERLKELKPCRFNFIQGDPNYVVDGFIAHEAQEVVPEAVTGEKDAIDEDNNPLYQGIDQSKVVPLLTAALQEAISKIEQLETRIQTLENN